MKKEDLKIGDIIKVEYDHYYGTGVNFYKVAKLCAKTIQLLPLSDKYIYFSLGGDKATSVPGVEIETRKKHFIRFVDGIAKVGKDIAQVWDGRPVTTYSYS